MVNTSSRWTHAAPATGARVARTRRTLWQLLEVDGLSLEQAAAQVGLPAARARALADDERARRRLTRFATPTIPAYSVRAWLEGCSARRARP